MSITILSQPSTYLASAGNDSTFTVSGSNALAPNVFDYQYIANVLINGVVSTTLKVFPDTVYNYGVFNMRNIVSNFVSYNFPYTDTTASIFQTASNSYCQVQLQFGEQYTAGATFSQSLNLTSSNTFAYLNSSLTMVDQINTNLSTYQVTSATSSAVNFLSTFSGSSYTYNNLRNHLHFYISSSAATYLSVQTFDSNNNQLGSYTIQNPYSGSGVYSIATGNPILSQLVSGSVGLNGQYVVQLGNSSMFNSSAVSYNVGLVNSSQGPLTRTKNYIIGDNTGRWQNYITNVYFLNDRGGFEAYQMNKKNEQSINKTVSTYKKQPGTLQSNGQFVFNTYDRQTSNYFTELENSIDCHTNWLSNVECLYLLRNLFSSPVIFLEDVNGVLQAANLKDDDYKIMNSTLNKGNQVKFTFKLSGQDYRQML